MDARLRCAALLAAALVSLGASHRTTNFIVKARTPALAREVAEAAEKFRKELALEWLGRELPRWTNPCRVTVQDGPNLGAGGATSFTFPINAPRQYFIMSIQGSRKRILDSVLPHEVTHTIFATHFQRPLPRWADEGACTTVEHEEEKSKQRRMLIQFLTTGRGIAFNRMFAMKEYPRDILPLYSQGYALARYLIYQGGKRKFVRYVGAGMQSNNWHETTQKFYGFRDLSDLQVRWLAWVKQGAPALRSQDDTQLVSVPKSSPSSVTNATTASGAASTTSGSAQNSPPAEKDGLGWIARGSRTAGEPTSRPAPSATSVALDVPRPGSVVQAGPSSPHSWYARRRDEALGRQGSAATSSENAPVQLSRQSQPRSLTQPVVEAAAPRAAQPAPATPLGAQSKYGGLRRPLYGVRSRASDTIRR